MNGKNAVQSARTRKAIYAAALASPVLATPRTPGLSGVEIAGARLLMNQDGTINVQSGATEIGQGADTVFSQMVAETVGGSGQATFALFQHKIPMFTPFDPGAFASRQSYVAAPALRSAALLLKEKIIAHAAVMLHQSAMNLNPDKRPYRAD
ncbi:xanthine dehydrogenase subunit XdhA [Escherichia coli]|uniref:Xanthine dehydrogenase subunit XdhA n=1 Tax=Escherichia coli TaxID=562 RepID=A0A376LA89_ECOLX|nr:xanthine dehydrogenase subunit XdhA [Escherichia coli]